MSIFRFARNGKWCNTTILEGVWQYCQVFQFDSKVPYWKLWHFLLKIENDMRAIHGRGRARQSQLPIFKHYYYNLSVVRVIECAVYDSGETENEYFDFIPSSLYFQTSIMAFYQKLSLPRLPIHSGEPPEVLRKRV